ncbi:hypothetical protein ACEYYB_14895 [Paracoccus sp. p4-l81]|uniref:hypothetical protein n=1 Tax=Paracoccus sp. p4-l81 TaxID=3342806 RepID=UPI0035BA2D9A
MSKSLAERLQEKLEGQTAEIAALTDSELKKLSAHVQSSLDEELSDIRIVIDRHLGGIANDLPVLKWTLFGTWAALIVSLMLTGFLLWRSTQATPPPIAPEPFETFQSEGQTYLLVPNGAEAARCTNRSGQEQVCLRLPMEN